MIYLILQAIVPVAFVLLLGYYAGHKKLVSQEGAKNFSVFIINLALPSALFVGIFLFTPSQLEDIPYLLTVVIALVLPFIMAIVIGRFVFKKSVPESGLFACNCGFPDMAYFGLPVLLAVVGTQALLPIIVGNLVTSILIVPMIVLMLHHGRDESGEKEPVSFLNNVLTTLKQPVVWAPILGLILVLIGVTLPPLINSSIKLIGNTTGGVALFTLGVLLSAIKFQMDLAALTVIFLKNILMPALALGLALFFHLDSSLTKGVIIIAACPSATMGAMFSAKFREGINTIPGEILASNVVGIATMVFWIFIAEKIG